MKSDTLYCMALLPLLAGSISGAIADYLFYFMVFIWALAGAFLLKGE